MKHATIFALTVLGAATLLTPPARSAGGDQPDSARMFAKQCASCHTVPDPGLSVDKVWINQVRETT